MSSSSFERQQIESVIGSIESQRSLLGDSLADASLAPLRARLEALAPSVDATYAPILKQVTILFLDIVESTILSRSLDAEDTQAVLDGALSRFEAVIAGFKGRVLSYAGDSLLAVFGADEALEDDAERAVRAALELLNTALVYGQWVAERFGFMGFAARVGAHTGNVLLEMGLEGKITVHGVAVNIASRMEQSAEPGTIRISDDTYRQIRGIFVVEAQPPLKVKGLEQPMTTYFVVEAKPRAFRVTTRGIEGVETRMIGRNAELQLLQDAFMRLYRQPGFTVIAVVAEAGIGKSRLLYEFGNWAEAQQQRFLLFRGRADPQMRDKPYGLLRDILMWRLEIRDTDSLETAKRSFEDRLSLLLHSTPDETPSLQARVHNLGQLIGFDFSDSPHVPTGTDGSEQIRRSGFEAAAMLFRTLTRRRKMPVVMMLDDLHWADAVSIEFLSHLSELDDVPVLVLALARPELFDRGLQWPALTASRRIDLTPLDIASSRSLVDELLKKLGTIPSTLREVIIGGAEGNPFYMEELVKVLIDQGAIRLEEDSWHVEPARLLAVKLPPTLAGVLQARLDGLPSDERKALQLASIIGNTFWKDALAEIDIDAVDALPALTRKNLIQAKQGIGAQVAHEYTFSHHLLQSAVYQTITKKVRKDIHGRVAKWLVERVDARGTGTIGVAAEHFEKAGDERSAYQCFTVASEQAQRLYAHDAALNHSSRAMRLASDRDDRDACLFQWRLLAVRERTLDVLGRRAEQRAAIEAMIDLSNKLGDEELSAWAAWSLCDWSFRVSDYLSMERHARDAIALARKTPNVELRMRAQQRQAIALHRLGQSAAGRDIALEGLEDARDRHLYGLETDFRTALSIIDATAGNVESRLLEVRRAASFNRDSGNLRAQAKNYINIGVQLIGFGDYDGARSNVKEALDLLKSIGDLPTKPYALANLSVIEFRRDQYPLALAHANEALAIALQVGEPFVAVWSRCCIGDAQLAIEDAVQAKAAFAAAYLSACSGPDMLRFDAAAGLVRVALAEGNLADARRAIEPILEHLLAGRSLDGTETPHGIRLTCLKALGALGDDRSDEILAIAYRAVQRQLEGIVDERIRHSFLNNVSEHREIVSAWRARGLS